MVAAAAVEPREKIQPAKSPDLSNWVDPLSVVKSNSRSFADWGGGYWIVGMKGMGHWKRRRGRVVEGMGEEGDGRLKKMKKDDWG